jgi:TPP-dependent pyruvate/acetoin dehydrogenase alpha subunit
LKTWIDLEAEVESKRALQLYRKMVQIRKFEEKLYQLFLTTPMPGSMHQYNGQEAVAVGVCAHLNGDDFITSTHRGHGHCIAKGAPIRAIMAEMFAKKTGCCRGMGGSMHIADNSVGMLGATGIVGSGLPIAVGAAWSCQYRRSGQVVVCFFGDGAANEGAFHEALNLAGVWKLPIVFVCENNVYGFSTHYRRVTPVEHIADRAAAYSMPGAVVDGMDLNAVLDEASTAVDRARSGDGPTLIECKTYRYMGHSRFEKATYRIDGELEEWRKRDPLVLFSDFLLRSMNVKTDELEGIDKEVEREMEDAVEYAKSSPDPDPHDYRQFIFS